ncbi:type VII secretion protein EccB [Actinoallomurus sp. NPDC052308]|uniref:type VII secretion protein EccB n=1 Tax=Actinoallomurus sp. NPDC052308 TaxID=3155530 RepID=UPI00341D1796
MQTRKDLLQAHRLMTQRASQALMLGEPDTPEQPMRRLNVASFIGVMVAILVMAGFGIIGLIRNGGSTQGLEEPGTIIIEKETGARYIWCLDGSRKLCPVANYTSAKLLSGADASKQHLVSRDSLAKYDRGQTVGIPGAPDTLPDANKLVKMPWSACVRAADLPNGGHTSLVTLVAGKTVGGNPLPAYQAIVVQADQQPWMIWHNKRMRVSAQALPALTSTASVPKVAPKWLNALTPGADFRAPAIPGLGQNATGPNGQGRVGQVFTVPNVTGTNAASYVLMADGLAPVSDIEARLLTIDPAVKAALGDQAGPYRISPDAFSGAPKHAGSITNPDLQGGMPGFITYSDTTPLCATYSDASGNAGAQVTLGATLSAPPDNAYGGASNADQLIFPPGGAALVGVLPGQGKRDEINTVFLVTDGRRFALQSKDVAQKLGYTLSTDAVPVPAGVVGLIPNGPILDPTAARNPIVQAGQPSAQPTG